MTFQEKPWGSDATPESLPSSGLQTGGQHCCSSPLPPAHHFLPGIAQDKLPSPVFCSQGNSAGTWKSLLLFPWEPHSTAISSSFCEPGWWSPLPLSGQGLYLLLLWCLSQPTSLWPKGVQKGTVRWFCPFAPCQEQLRTIMFAVRHYKHFKLIFHSPGQLHFTSWFLTYRQVNPQEGILLLYAARPNIAGVFCFYKPYILFEKLTRKAWAWVCSQLATKGCWRVRTQWGATRSGRVLKYGSLVTGALGLTQLLTPLDKSP